MKYILSEKVCETSQNLNPLIRYYMFEFDIKLTLDILMVKEIGLHG